MGDVKLAGEDGTGVAAAGDKFRLTRFLPLDGLASSIRFQSAAPGKIKVAIYLDDEGVPGTLLRQGSDEDVLGGELVTIPIDELALSSDAYIWIAYVSDVSVPYMASGGSTQTTNVDYDTFGFPNEAGNGAGAISFTLLLSVYGILATGGAGRLIGVGDPSMITVGHPKLISAGLSPSLIRGP